LKSLNKQEAVHVHTSRTTCRVPTETDAEEVGSKTWSRGEKQSATKTKGERKREKAKGEMTCQKNAGVKKRRRKGRELTQEKQLHQCVMPEKKLGRVS